MLTITYKSIVHFQHSLAGMQEQGLIQLPGGQSTLKWLINVSFAWRSPLAKGNKIPI